MTQIKTHIFETPKARVLVVGGLPEDVPKWGLAGKAGKPPELLISVVKEDFDCFGENVNPKYVFDIPKGNWQRLGKLSEITEEQWKGIVEEHPVLGGFGYYKDTVPSFFDTAKKAGLSLIESEVCLKNPHGNEKQFYYGEQGMTNEEFDKKVTQYKSAEEQVFHNPVLFWEKK